MPDPPPSPSSVPAPVGEGGTPWGPLLEELRCEALLVLAQSARDPDLAHFTGPAHVGRSLLVLPRRGAGPRLGFFSPMEREEAAGTGLELLSPEALGIDRAHREGWSEAHTTAAAAAAALAACGLAPGRLALAGQGPVGERWETGRLLEAGGWRLVDGNDLARRVRKHKGPGQLAGIRRAASGTEAAFRRVAELLAATTVRPLPETGGTSARTSDGAFSETGGTSGTASGTGPFPETAGTSDGTSDGARSETGGTSGKAAVTGVSGGEAASGELWLEGERLTVGRLRAEVARVLAEHGLEQPAGNIVAPGRDAGIPHSAGHDDQVLRAGQALVVDLYPSAPPFADCTRTFCVGRPPEALARAHAAVLDALRGAHRGVRAGTRGWDLQREACRVLEEAGYPTPLTDPHSVRGYVHNLGHGVGYELHEYPSFRRHTGAEGVLATGDVLTLEPGLYDPDDGWGVRLEDLVHLGPDGPENLVHLPYDLDPRAWQPVAEVQGVALRSPRGRMQGGGAQAMRWHR